MPVEMQAVSSSNISEVGYDEEARELHVEFSSGGLYIYSNVPPAIAEGLLTAPSPGGYLARNVKDVYAHRRA